MSSTAAGWLQFALLVVALAACYVPLGNYMARIFTDTRHWRVERGIYKLCGIDPEADMRWGVYVRSILAFSLVGVLFLYLLERTQHWLFLSVGMANVTPVTAWNTAASFVTNTNWQNYGGESTMSYLTQMGGLAVQNFLSAAVGLAVAIAMIRGFTRSRTDKLGNFWVDLTRGTIRLLLPISVIGAIILIAGGLIQNFADYHTITTLAGGHQIIPGGPVASQEVIKDLGNNGGGFFNANSAHPFESPNGFTDIFEIFLLLLIPFSLPRTFGKMVRDNKQGFALLAGMYGILVLAIVTVFVAGLMVGRTPEYIGKKIRPVEMKYASLYFLTLPVVILTAAALSIGTKVGQDAIFNPGPHGLTEVMYAFASMANNNGSAFAGLGTAATWYQVVGGIVMLIGRFAPEIFALGLAGSLARQAPVPQSAGTLDTRTPLFVGMLVGVILILVGLTYFPALALGPFAEGLH